MAVVCFLSDGVDLLEHVLETVRSATVPGPFFGLLPNSMYGPASVSSSSGSKTTWSTWSDATSLDRIPQLACHRIVRISVYVFEVSSSKTVLLLVTYPLVRL